jgi:hypothetical protein
MNVHPNGPVPIDVLRNGVAERFDQLIDEAYFPPQWPRLWQEVGLFLMDQLQPVNHHLIQELKQLHDRARDGERGYGRADPVFLDQLVTALTQLEADLRLSPFTLDHAHLGAQIEDLLDRVTARVEHGHIWLDAIAIGLANFLGYIAGTCLQTWIERSFCEGGGELSYGKRVSAELANRTAQHAVRFLLRDIAIPAVKQLCGWKTLQVSQNNNLWFFLAVLVVVSACDQSGVWLLKQLPPVKTTGHLQWPDAFDNSVQTSIFSATDVMAWVLIGYFAQLRFKGWYQKERAPFKDLHFKALIHTVQAITEGLCLSAWKNAQEGLNPNNLCLPGTASARVHRYHGDMSRLKDLDHRDYVNVMRLNSTHVIYPAFSDNTDHPLLDRALLERPPEYHQFVALFDSLELGVHGGITALRGGFNRNPTRPQPPRAQQPQPQIVDFANARVNPEPRGGGDENPDHVQGVDPEDDANIDEEVLPGDDPLAFPLTEIERKLRQYVLPHHPPRHRGHSGHPRPLGQA